MPGFLDAVIGRESGLADVLMPAPLTRWEHEPPGAAVEPAPWLPREFEHTDGSAAPAPVRQSRRTLIGRGRRSSVPGADVAARPASSRRTIVVVQRPPISPARHGRRSPGGTEVPSREPTVTAPVATTDPDRPAGRVDGTGVERHQPAPDAPRLVSDLSDDAPLGNRPVTGDTTVSVEASPDTPPSDGSRSERLDRTPPQSTSAEGGPPVPGRSAGVAGEAAHVGPPAHGDPARLGDGAASDRGLGASSSSGDVGVGDGAASVDRSPMPAAPRAVRDGSVPGRAVADSSPSTASPREPAGATAWTGDASSVDAGDRAPDGSPPRAAATSAPVDRADLETDPTALDDPSRVPGDVTVLAGDPRQDVADSGANGRSSVDRSDPGRAEGPPPDTRRSAIADRAPDRTTPAAATRPDPNADNDVAAGRRSRAGGGNRPARPVEDNPPTPRRLEQAASTSPSAEVDRPRGGRGTAPALDGTDTDRSRPGTSTGSGADAVGSGPPHGAGPARDAVIPDSAASPAAPPTPGPRSTDATARRGTGEQIDAARSYSVSPNHRPGMGDQPESIDAARRSTDATARRGMGDQPESIDAARRDPVSPNRRSQRRVAMPVERSEGRGPRAAPPRTSRVVRAKRSRSSQNGPSSLGRAAPVPGTPRQPTTQDAPGARRSASPSDGGLAAPDVAGPSRATPATPTSHQPTVDRGATSRRDETRVSSGRAAVGTAASARSPGAQTSGPGPVSGAARPEVARSVGDQGHTHQPAARGATPRVRVTRVRATPRPAQPVPITPDVETSRRPTRARGAGPGVVGPVRPSPDDAYRSNGSPASHERVVTGRGRSGDARGSSSGPTERTPPPTPTPGHRASLGSSAPADAAARKGPARSGPGALEPGSPRWRAVSEQQQPAPQPADESPVHIHIGRLRIGGRSAKPASRPTPAPSRSGPKLSLDAYLTRKRGAR